MHHEKFSSSLLFMEVIFMLSFFSSGLCSLGYEYFSAIGLDTVTGCYPSVDATSINGIILVVADGTVLTSYTFNGSYVETSTNITQSLSQYRPESSVKVLDNERYMVSWVEEESGEVSLMGSICNRTNGCNSKFQISQSASDSLSPRITVIGDTGKIMMAWTEPDGANKFKIMFRMYDVNGNPQTAPKALGTPRVYDHSYYDIGSLFVNSNWRVMLAYSDVTKASGVQASLVTSTGVVETSFEISNRTFNATRLAISPNGTWIVVGDVASSIYSIAGIGTNVYNSSVIAAGFQRPANVGGDTMWYHGPAVCAVGTERTYVTAMSITPFTMIGFKAVRDASTLENNNVGDVGTAEYAALAGLPGSNSAFVVSYCNPSTNQVISKIGNFQCLTIPCSSFPSPWVIPSATPSITPSITPSRSPSTSSSSAAEAVAKNSSNTAVVAGVSAGAGTLFVGALIFLGCVVLRRKRDKKTDKQQEPDQEVQYELSTNANQQNTANYENKKDVVQKPKDYSNIQLEEGWRIPYSEVTVKNELGRGAFGVVYRCTWQGTNCVVKRLNSEAADHASKISFIKEANAMRKVGNHPNLCLLLGVCDDPMAIFMEFVEGGSLWHCLTKKKIPMTTSLAIKFAKDIAQGMKHLHSVNIIHMDLACRNLLVVVGQNNNFAIKITDFGLSRVLDPYKELYIASESAVFPIRWTALETLTMRIIAKPSDVWSFGVTLWELMESEFPYPTLNNAQVIEGVSEGLRPERPKSVSVPESLWQLMESTWRETPSERPTFHEICTQLDVIDNEWKSQ